MSEVKWLAIVGLLACFFGTGFLSIDKVGPARVNRWVAACNRFLTSERRFPLLIASVGIAALFLNYVESFHFSIFLNCVLREARVLAVAGFALLTEVLYLWVLGKAMLRRLISGGKSVRLQRFLSVLTLLFPAGPAIYALGFGNTTFSVISLSISISMASGFSIVLIASGLVECTLGMVRFLDCPGRAISRFAVIGFGLLALGFVLQLVYIFLT